jgi:hypothetical protein
VKNWCLVGRKTPKLSCDKNGAMAAWWDVLSAIRSMWL